MIATAATVIILTVGVSVFSRQSDPLVRTDGAWNWFTNPRAVSYDGYTYFGQAGTDGDAIVSRLDEDTEDIESFILHEGLQIDDHANPALLVRPDGRITAFYSAHNGADLFHRTTKRPGDIRAWSTEKSIGTNSAGEKGYTYPNPIYLPGEGSIYLFWRGADWQPTFSVSSDMGKTWGEARRLIESPGERPYVLYRQSGDRIHIAFSEAHPRDLPTSLYYMYYEKGGFYRADGSLIKSIDDLPVIPREADIVYDAGSLGAASWAWDIATDPRGYPVIIYARFPKPDDHRYRYVTYDAGWHDFEFARGGGFTGGAGEPQYSGGMALDESDPKTVYISKGKEGDFSLEKITILDGGKVMESEMIATKGENIRPVHVDGSDGRAVLLWISGRYGTYMRYDTSVDHKIF